MKFTGGGRNSGGTPYAETPPSPEELCQLRLLALPRSPGGQPRPCSVGSAAAAAQWRARRRSGARRRGGARSGQLTVPAGT